MLLSDFRLSLNPSHLASPTSASYRAASQPHLLSPALTAAPRRLFLPFAFRHSPPPPLPDGPGPDLALRHSSIELPPALERNYAAERNPAIERTSASATQPPSSVTPAACCRCLLPDTITPPSSQWPALFPLPFFPAAPHSQVLTRYFLHPSYPLTSDGVSLHLPYSNTFIVATPSSIPSTHSPFLFTFPSPSFARLPRSVLLLPVWPFAPHFVHDFPLHFPRRTSAARFVRHEAASTPSIPSSLSSIVSPYSLPFRVPFPLPHYPLLFAISSGPPLSTTPSLSPFLLPLLSSHPPFPSSPRFHPLSSSSPPPPFPRPSFPSLLRYSDPD
ncbi:hypothetical protein DFH06DRAFT_1476076 [Mycena polygramma]|nr:hypothetical protein DFH06DRAFT_1476076 [Mycena polygramma]